MSIAASFLPKPIDLLPESDPRFLRAVYDVALLGGGLMQIAGGGLIAAPFLRDGEEAGSIVLWDRDMTHSPEGEMLIRATRSAAPALDALAATMADLHERLGEWRWRGLDSSYGVVTDGNAVAMLPSPPDRIGMMPDATGWNDGGRNDGSSGVCPVDTTQARW